MRKRISCRMPKGAQHGRLRGQLSLLIYFLLVHLLSRFFHIHEKKSSGLHWILIWQKKFHLYPLFQELPEGKWFCSSDCGRIHDSLQSLLASGPEELPVFRTDVIKKKQDDNAPREEINLDIRWRILSGKAASPETRLFLSKALSIFYVSTYHIKTSGIATCFLLHNIFP